ncbi:MAG TPA: response regulator transcription factor, partial [Roseiflexaceae bacterium]|nr:response regulator transcription factor [Roseiflexaceae bacterium]
LASVHQVYQRVHVTERMMANGRQLLSANGASTQPRPIPITEREREILGWLREGKSNQQIAEQLGISALTVKNHVQKILRKLGAANRAQAVAQAMTLQLLDRAPAATGVVRSRLLP